MKNLILLALCVVLVLIVGLMVFLLASSPVAPARSLSLAPLTSENEKTDRADQTYTVPLYFLSIDQRYLARERRPVVLKGGLEQRLAMIVEELLKGPTLRNLVPAIPPGADLQALFWDESEKRVIISLSRQFLDGRPGHALAEWASIFSLVNTVTDHDSAIRSVQILVDGEIVEDGTLWDLSEPFVPDHTFVLYGPTETTGASL